MTNWLVEFCASSRGNISENLIPDWCKIEGKKNNNQQYNLHTTVGNPFRSRFPFEGGSLVVPPPQSRWRSACPNLLSVYLLSPSPHHQYHHLDRLDIEFIKSLNYPQVTWHRKDNHYHVQMMLFYTSVYRGFPMAIIEYQRVNQTCYQWGCTYHNAP